MVRNQQSSAGIPNHDKTGIKLISLNIEGDKHLDQIISFLQKEKADVLCLQEVFDEDLSLLEKSLNMKGEFVAEVVIKRKNYLRINPRGAIGLLILTRGRVAEVKRYYYVGNDRVIPEFSDTDNNIHNRILLLIKILKGGREFTIATTHFTWSPEGKATPRQHRTLDSLFKIFNKNNIRECILCGDFNAPRGGDIFSRLAKKFTDNIPEEILTTIDPNLHRVKNLQRMVDGLFTTREYECHNVRVIGGLSDHKAIVGLVKKI